MMGKQYILDIVIVLLVPTVIIGGYYLWWRPDSSAVLAVSSGSQLAAGTPGAKVKLALQTLKTINIDGSLFTDPAFLTLKEFPVMIPTVPLSRPNPFIPSPEVLEMHRASRSSAVRAPTSAPATAPTISSTLDQLQKNIPR